MKDRYLNQENHYLFFAKEIFGKHFPLIKEKESHNNLSVLYNRLSDEYKNKLLKISFFYYFRGWRLMQKEKWYEEVMEDFVFIVLISITEYLISNKKRYTDKFIYFFCSCLSELDRDNLSDKVKIFSEEHKKFDRMSVEEIARMFYKLRSGFIHKADYIPLSARADISSFSYEDELSPIKDRAYSVSKKFEEIVSIFERGFLNYFISKIK